MRFKSISQRRAVMARLKERDMRGAFKRGDLVTFNFAGQKVKGIYDGRAKTGHKVNVRYRGKSATIHLRQQRPRIDIKGMTTRR